MKNKATLKFKNFTARPRSFWIRPKLTRVGAALCCARPVEAICLKRSSADATPSGVRKNLKSRNFKSLNFKNRNATGANYVRLNIDQYIIFNAYHDINSSADHGINSNANSAVNFKISNANLKADLARPKADFR